MRVIDEHRANGTIDGRPYVRVRNLSAERHRHRSDSLTRRDTPVSRDHDIDVVSKGRERARQRAEHVRESARFGERLRLGRDHQYSHCCYDRTVSDSASRPARPPRAESREAVELHSIRERHPELASAVDLHLELLELQRRIQVRVPLPSLECRPTSSRDITPTRVRFSASKTFRST
jgi:hypothetical protein